MALKLCPLIEYHIKNIFMEKSCRKCAPKASSRAFFKFGNPKQPLHARNSLKNKIFWKKIIKKVNFIFSSKPSPFQWTKLSKINRGLELVTSPF